MKILATNKKAYHDYEILSTLETGISLLGTEVKSAKEGRMNLKDSYIKVIGGEVYLINCHISPYTHGNILNHDPIRTRKLLLHKKEINKLIGLSKEKGLTIVPLKAYLKNNLIKIEAAVVRGKKKFDKRETMRRKEVDREIERAIKNKITKFY
ncbi:MAG: SsrA-binding protein SmpB [Deferribacterota bacterium]|nr:SsrA-binding protein SmpB [Deferribacterota bacterium]